MALAATSSTQVDKRLLSLEEVAQELHISTIAVQYLVDRHKLLLHDGLVDAQELGEALLDPKIAAFIQEDRRVGEALGDWNVILTPEDLRRLSAARPGRLPWKGRKR